MNFYCYTDTRCKPKWINPICHYYILNTFSLFLSLGGNLYKIDGVFQNPAVNWTQGSQQTTRRV